MQENEMTLRRTVQSITGSPVKKRFRHRWFRSSTHRRVACGGLLLALAACSAVPSSPPSISSHFDLLISNDAVVRVHYEELAELGFKSAESRRIRVSHNGSTVPVHVQDSDGHFGPGDWVEFRGLAPNIDPAGSGVHARFNVYKLGYEKIARKKSQIDWATITQEPHQTGKPGRVVQLQELDKIRVRFGKRQQRTRAQSWFWARVSPLETFTYGFDLAEVDSNNPQLALSLSLTGWSSQRGTGVRAVDHVVEVVLNGHLIASGEWDLQRDHVIDVESVRKGWVRPTNNLLEIRVPKRVVDNTMIVDVVLVDWVRLSYQHNGLIGSTPIKIVATETPLEIRSAADEGGIVYSDSGRRFKIPPAGSMAITPLKEETSFFAVPGNQWQPPVSIRVDHPSDLRSTRRGVDYVMIAHSSLLEAARPLAEFRSSQGLGLMLIDVQDIFDEFSHGRVDPNAIRQFLHHAHRHWNGSAGLRFALLVGDASWDSHNDQVSDANYADWTYRGQADIHGFGKNASTSYDDLERFRNLVPALSVPTSEGFAASDNAMVSFDGDWRPELAIGRLPASNPMELGTMVNKIIAYESEPSFGPWRRNILWVTNEESRLQDISDALLSTPNSSLYSSSRIYPRAENTSNASHQQRLVESLDAGQVLVHFLGHGGRYIWRTGPPDPFKNHDLFTLDHLDTLSRSPVLPLVLSMTCYTAPFDHPTADSLGEKFLRVEGRGAIAVFGASWRNVPTRRFSGILLDALLQNDVTIGEAIMHAKRRAEDRVMVETYNLLGDPSTRLAIPKYKLELQVDTSGGQLTVHSDLPPDGGPSSGTAIAEWIDAFGMVINQSTQEIKRGRLNIIYKNTDSDKVPVAVRVYAWSDQSGRDAIGFAHVGENPVVEIDQ